MKRGLFFDQTEFIAVHIVVRTGITVIKMFYSSSNNSLGEKTYLSIRNATVSSLVGFIHELGDLLVGDVESSGLNNSSDLVLRDLSIVVQIE